MLSKKIAVLSLAACGLLLAMSSHAGMLWTFKNAGNTTDWTAGGYTLSHASGKMVVTADGTQSDAYIWGTVDPAGYPGNSAPFSINPLLTIRFTATTAGSSQAGEVMYFDGLLSKWQTKSFAYHAGDGVYQIDLRVPDLNSDGTQPASLVGNITNVCVRFTHGTISTGVVAEIDYIAIGDEEFTGPTPPAFYNSFDVEDANVTNGWIGSQVSSGQMFGSWDSAGRVHYTYDPGTATFDPFMFCSVAADGVGWGGYDVADRKYTLFGLDVLPNPPGTVEWLDFLILADGGSVMSLTYVQYYQGSQIVFCDPFYGDYTGVPSITGIADWTMIQMPDAGTTDVAGNGTYSPDMYTDFDWFFQGNSIVPILEDMFAPLDTDGDGLSDIGEIAYGTDASDADTDGDGLTDGDEVDVYDTNPLSVDTDGDGYPDGEEVDAGTDPTNPADNPGGGGGEPQMPVATTVMLGLLAVASLAGGVQALRRG